MPLSLQRLRWRHGLKRLEQERRELLEPHLCKLEQPDREPPRHRVVDRRVRPAHAFDRDDRWLRFKPWGLSTWRFRVRQALPPDVLRLWR